MKELVCVGLSPATVATPQRDAAAHHLEIEPSAAARAVVEDEIRMPVGQLVEIAIEAGDVPNLTQADPVGLLPRLPEEGGMLDRRPP